MMHQEINIMYQEVNAHAPPTGKKQKWLKPLKKNPAESVNVVH